MSKHAYLLLVHENTLVLKRLLQLLDDERNDIFIHIDKNSSEINADDIRKIVYKSNVFFVKRHRVYWGTNSITNAEICLLKKAIKKEYAYYHLLSGVDLPIKKQNQIHDFFDNNQGKEFIHFGTKQYQNDIKERYEQYHFFTKQLGRKRDKKFWVDMETYSLAIQRRLHVNRGKKCKFTFYGGSNWISITNDFAKYIVKEYKKFKKYIRFVQISDELIWQTMIMNSQYKNNIYMPEFENNYEACVRYIDWERGNPYVFDINDYSLLMNSKCMFARKFDERKDNQIIEKIYETVKIKE